MEHKEVIKTKLKRGRRRRRECARQGAKKQ
jgi:hypothetical protein